MVSGQRIVLPAIVGLLALGCDFKGSAARNAAAGAPETAPADPGAAPAAAAQPPTRIIYPADQVTYTRGQPITPNIPFVAGGRATNFSLTPPLPHGLSLDPATGTITGTPTEVTGTLTFTVTASNPLGSTDGTLTLAVHDQAPSQAPAIQLAPFVTAGRAGAKASVPPEPGASTTYAWTVTGGTLTAGQGTTAILLTPGEPGALRVTLTVGNTGGNVTGSADAVIVPAPDATLTFPVAVHPGDTGVTASVPPQPGAEITWEVLNGSASASLASGQGTSVLGLAAGTAEGTFQLQVHVQNQAGDRANASATIAVKQ